MYRPPEGLCLPAKVIKVRDADTVEVSILAGRFRPAIRLIDCWAPENGTPLGDRATKHVRQMLREWRGNIYVWIPSPKNLKNLLRNLTFDRIPGHIFVRGDMTLSEMLVRDGYAGTTKETQPKEG